MNCSNVGLQPLEDRCQFVKLNCDDVSGFVNWSQLYFCGDHQPLVFFSMLLALFYLFVFFGTTSANFFCPNLATMSTYLGLSETVAGVTLAALGNGAPDIFSTFSAMRSHAGGLAVGELLGATLFITLVVTGSVAVTAAAQLPRRPFLRDIVFLFGTVLLVYFVIRDRKITFWESLGLIMYYIIYVATVVIANMIYRHQKASRMRLESASRLLQSEDDNGYDERDSYESMHAFVPHFGNVEFPFLLARESHIRQSDSEPVSIPSCFLGSIPLQQLAEFLIPNLTSFRSLSVSYKIWAVITAPIVLLLRGSVPVVYNTGHNHDTEGHHGTEAIGLLDPFADEVTGDTTIYQNSAMNTDNWVFALQLLSTSQLIAIAFRPSIAVYALIFFGGITVSAVGFYVSPASNYRKPFQVTTGFLCSILWIYFVASEIVGIFSAVALVFELNPAILGLTLFAFGNCIGDIIANTSISRLGHSTMAVAACFGAPMMNMLMGIGVTTLSITISSGEAYSFLGSKILDTTCIALLVSLAITGLIVPLLHFKIGRMFGACLLAEYVAIIFIILRLTSE